MNNTAPAPIATFSPGDPRSHFADAVATAVTVVSAIRPEQLADATPCDLMDVRALSGHVVAVMQRVAGLGRGNSFYETPDAVTDIADDAWPAAAAAAAHHVLDVWLDPSLLERTYELPWAELPGFALMGVYTNEITVHTWDLAVATGQSPHWTPSTLSFAYDAIRMGLPETGRVAEFEEARASMPEEYRNWNMPFAEAVVIGDDAPLIDRLVAYNGRDPRQ
jgi:uncharacterized protein (TIGR03086 family)